MSRPNYANFVQAVTSSSLTSDTLHHFKTWATRRWLVKNWGQISHF